MNMSMNYDVIQIGGGLAGSLNVLALAEQGFTCALIDAESPQTLADEAFDGRTTAIAYASARVFKRLGVWDAVVKGAGPINDILVTDGRPDTDLRAGAVSPFSLHFDSDALDDSVPLGWIVENRNLRRALFEAIAKSSDITVFAPARAISAEREEGGACVRLDTGETLNAPLICAADGRGSRLRAEANIKTHRWGYGQTAIVTVVGHERDHQGVAQEFFLPGGPFAILPMTENRVSIVWTEKTDLAETYLRLDDDAFMLELSRRFGDYLGALHLAAPRSSYPLSLNLASRFVANRLALIGDAAHGIHPIAGQGYNLGVKDAAVLADVLTQARYAGLDIGGLDVLNRYERWRRFDVVSLALGTDALNRLFSNDNPLLRTARDIGLGAVSAVPGLGKFFMRQAGADVGDLPRLMAKGETSPWRVSPSE